MTSKTFEYILKLSGVNKTSQGLLKIANYVGKVNKSFLNLQETAIRAKYFGDAFQEASEQLQRMTQAGAVYESSMADLQAITGIAGKKLEDIGLAARKNAKIFGGDAAQSVESYKLLLSQLGPAIAQSPEALQAMGQNVSILSKTMGGDAKAATEVLTAAMNQFGVDLSNPIQASAEMATMMNIMAAAAKQGSAELPFIKLALENVGAVAKDANVSFAETNAAIQMLDKYGKRGAEGGVALRNVLATLGKGRFLQKEVLLELKQAGIDVDKLSDKTLSLSERLKVLAPIQEDGALLTKMFGTENQLAALALIQNAEEVNNLSNEIVGTNTATEQAQIVMGTFAEKMNRARAVINDLGIEIFEASKKYLPLIQFSSELLTVGGRLMPIVVAAGKAFMWTGKQLFFLTKATFKATFTLAKFGLRLLYNSALLTGKFIISLFKSTTYVNLFTKAKAFSGKVSLWWTGVQLRGALLLTFLRKKIIGAWQGMLKYIQSVRTGTKVQKLHNVSLLQTAKRTAVASAQWLLAGIKGLGGYIVSLASATAAQIGLNIAMSANPIGLIIIGLAAIGTAVYMIIKHWDVVKQWLLDLWGLVKKYNPFSYLINLLDKIFPGFKDKLSAWWDEIVSFFKGIIDFFANVYNEYIAPVLGLDEASLTINENYEPDKGFNPDSSGSDESPFFGDDGNQGGNADSTIQQGVADITSGGKKQTNITINLGKFQDAINIYSQNVNEGIDDMQDKLEMALLRVLNSGNTIANG